MASGTLFIALQCFECSTMQVKQKKKSSNKWVCVICNQKQSVKKVFAQGYKAKELRFFVQSFNMSRKVADEETQAVTDSFSEVDVEGDVHEEVSSFCGKKKRSDWSEYLEYNSPNDSRISTIEEDDVKIVTEMPNNMFKKPKLNKFSNAAGSSSVRGGDGSEFFKPSFSRRSIKTPDFCSGGVMARKEDSEQRNVKSDRETKLGSKWDAYLIQDEGEQHLAQPQTLKDDDAGEWDKAITEMSSDYQIVDDEVHPDFQ